jgi:hypothetical protein
VSEDLDISREVTNLKPQLPALRLLFRYHSGMRSNLTCLSTLPTLDIQPVETAFRQESLVMGTESKEAYIVW